MASEGSGVSTHRGFLVSRRIRFFLYEDADAAVRSERVIQVVSGVRLLACTVGLCGASAWFGVFFFAVTVYQFSDSFSAMLLSAVKMSIPSLVVRDSKSSAAACLV